MCGQSLYTDCYETQLRRKAPLALVGIELATNKSHPKYTTSPTGPHALLAVLGGKVLTHGYGGKFPDIFCFFLLVLVKVIYVHS